MGIHKLPKRAKFKAGSICARCTVKAPEIVSAAFRAVRVRSGKAVLIIFEKMSGYLLSPVTRHVDGFTARYKSETYLFLLWLFGHLNLIC